MVQLEIYARNNRNKFSVILELLEDGLTPEQILAFYMRTALAANGGNVTGLPAKTADKLHGYLDELAKAMLFGDAAPYTDPIRGNSGFDAWFSKQGPADPQGRSLRELDLDTRLLRYPLSYLVYTPAFDALPQYARDYVYGRFAAVLQGHDHSDTYAFMGAATRRDTLQILTATKPSFARYLAQHPAAVP